MHPDIRKRISLTNPTHFLALGFGSGLAPKMPGTFGSLAAIPLLLLMADIPLIAFLTLTVFACVLGVYLCDKTANDMQVHDHGSIVWDEIAGMLITFILVPINISTLALGFALFRLFDILKPWPIGPIDKKLHGGLGIMLDDIIAGFMACGVLHIVLYYFPQWFLA
ncbi:phosphatidylglycerophosphatase A [Alteromonas sp. KUL49]|uniref:phosphatidylglycerophosphatase A family protein n=1 Tax=Alteromonas sp. KUL49 TaxID=2480798 RepID=UPI00102F2541|nr:phosphatidylglycerophosphatase A [Alteromonas sp. KUL49]TAP39884.1 phosphatidylglycerophosphatase A [Alteromonas sp. KUL49]GEA11902.1 phosphatidylglycerophosphatase A [Alteromonas sp. KUL49]